MRQRTGFGFGDDRPFRDLREGRTSVSIPKKRKVLIRSTGAPAKATIEDVYDELKAIHSTLNELVAEVRAIKENLPESDASSHN
jgi:hypothetical protein